MVKSDALFELIKSMTTAEKRYFKNFTGGLHPKAELDYHHLFDALEKQSREGEAYHEKQLLHDLGPHWESKQLAVNKNYLYHSILRSLRYYHSEKTPRLQLKEWMIDIDLLYERGLSKDTLKYIRKAKKLASRYDYHLEYLELSLLERRIKRQRARKNTARIVQQLQKDCQAKLRHLDNQFEILDLYESVFLDVRNQNLTPHALDSLRLELERLLGQREDSLEQFSFEERIYYHLAYSMYYLFTRESTQRLYHLQQLLDYFEEHDHLLQDRQYQERYLSCLNNYINHCYLYQSGQELKQQIEKLRAFSPKGYSLQIQLSQYLYYAQMLYYFKEKDFAAVAAFGPDIEALLHQYGDQINLKRKLTFHINLAAAYLLENQYGQAQDQINLIINEPKFEIRRDIQMLSRIFQIILFYSQGNLDSAEYEVFKAMRYLKKFRNNNRTEKLIIGAFKKAIQQDRPDVLTELKEQLKESSGYEEIVFWLEKENKN